MSRRQAHPGRQTSKQRRSTEGELRIIGGDWRSRVLRFPDEGGVRPTPARTRETLFNWLNFQLPGSHCIDLFSGSGVLGLEALSRGASHVRFVDHTPALARALRDNLRKLNSDRGEVICQEVTDFLDQPVADPVDILFMDPPFRQGWPEQLIPLIADRGWVRPPGWIYLEYESDRAAPAVPAHWHLHRTKSAGQVTYALYQLDAEAGRNE